MKRAASSPKSAKAATSSANPEELLALFWELSFTYLRLNSAVQRWIGLGGESPGKISLMRSLETDGPQSVVQMARNRGVARQGVQQLADQLCADGLIESLENPAHKRAKLMRITPKGQKTLRRNLDEQAAFAKAVAADLEANQIPVAVNVLGRLRERLTQMFPTE